MSACTGSVMLYEVDAEDVADMFVALFVIRGGVRLILAILEDDEQEGEEETDL